MKNYLLTLAFDGTNYHGWQVQENAVTVQETLQTAAEQILGVRENIIGCSRTDAGVHANMFCCNLRTEKNIAPEKLQTALNAVLPRDIAVLECGEVPYDFHARYDCTGKTYQYWILNRQVRDPFYENRVYHYPWHIHTNLLHEQAQQFLGLHDFSAFCASKTAVEDKTREIRRMEVRRDGDFVKITVEGNGFLYNMVRIMVGTLLEINSGKLSRDSIPAILESKDRTKAGVTAPAQGLYLHKVYYDR
ncbi:MAG: tRNA pseudouridine(38-40) synthase TruA [Candidatus Fimenecus sp.]